jgi:integrase
VSYDLDVFEAFLCSEYSANTARKARRDVAALLRDPEVARPATSPQRAKDYWWAWTTWHWYATEHGAPDLPEDSKPPEPAAATRRRTKTNRGNRKLVTAIPRGPWRAMLELLEADTSEPAAVCLVLAHQALRVGDVLRTPREALKEALDRDDHVCTMHLKGDKPYLVRLGPALPLWLGLYGHMKVRRADVVAGCITPSGSEDPSSDGAAYKAVSRKLRKVAKLAGAKGVSVHRIRHTVAVELTEMGLTDHQIKDVLGHDDVATTGIYTKDAAVAARHAETHLTSLREWRRNTQ